MPLMPFKRCLKAVRATLDLELKAEDGDATAHGLALELSAPNFIAVLLLLFDIYVSAFLEAYLAAFNWWV